jgi:radical SAM protein with 4Fe4S-binding SPASM domain
VKSVELVQLRRSPRRGERGQAPHPRYVVWELTLKCDQRCAHCGSRAAEARADELTTAEALAVVAQLAAAGTQEVTLIGGEAYLHPGFLAIIAAITGAGLRASMTTGGRGLTAELAVQLAAAGMQSVAVSVDGLDATHDLVRARRGSFADAMAAIGHVRAAGLPVGCNTVVNRLNVDELEALYEALAAAGMRGWQVQLLAPMGRAADRPELLLQPWQLLELVPRIARLKERAFGDGILLMPGNNVGYFSHDEKRLRSATPGGQDHWRGCQAGRFVMGIESDGAVKGCPSLPSRGYVGGNLRDRTLATIWDDTPELAFARRRTVDDLWGFCRQCPFASVCLAGCTFTAHSLLGRAGNNPYCHYRAKTLAAGGLRERLVLAERAPGEPFDNGRFDLVLEPFDTPVPPKVAAKSLLQVWKG